MSSPDPAKPVVEPSVDEKPTPPAPPPDNDKDAFKARKIAHLQARITSLAAEIAAKTAALEAVKESLKHPPSQTVQTHITLLHEYNEIRDIGQGLLGMVAEKRGVRVGELYRGDKDMDGRGEGGERGSKDGKGQEVGEFGVGVGD